MPDRRVRKVQEVVVNRVHWCGVPLTAIEQEINEARCEAEINGIDPDTLTCKTNKSPFRANYTIFQIVGERDETETEFLARIDEELKKEAEDKEERRKQYEELKKEFKE